jgi:hypothetical protein
MNKIEEARKNFKPANIKCLLIAESAPDINSKRFFYYDEYFKNGDILFMETMKALFPVDGVTGRHYKENKSAYLCKFQNAGFYLEDASSIPFPKGSSSNFKKRILEKEFPFLLIRLQSIISKKTPIVLIANTVYDVCFDRLNHEGFNVMNTNAIPFPISNQSVFRADLVDCVSRINL